MHLHMYFKYTAHNKSNIIIIKNAIYNLDQGVFVLQNFFLQNIIVMSSTSMSPQRDSHMVFIQHTFSYGKPSWKLDKYKLTFILIVLRQLFSVRYNYLIY
jgi:hypothetical protein